MKRKISVKDEGVGMQKKVTLITGSTNTKRILYEQLKEFVPEPIAIEAFASEEGLPPVLQCDLLIISSASMMEELEAMGIALLCADKIVCERTINFDYIDQVANIPANEEVLLVNDEKETAESAINDLIDLGLNHIRYYPYYPGIASYKRLRIAITPGEPDSVPAFVTDVINMGPRILDINTIYSIMGKLDLNIRDTSFFTKRYMQKIIHVSKSISAIHNSVNTLNGYLNNIVDNLVNGILVYDENGYIKYANEEMKKVLSIDKRGSEGKNLKNIVDRELLQYFLGRDVYENKALSIMGMDVKMSKFMIPNSSNVVVTTNRDEKDRLKKTLYQDLLLKGHLAKYNFSDIIGSSSHLDDTKDIALKLSKSELTVLIEGESGTGKELFASAIHNNSKRKYGPFLAVNFSALPDELIESELFGYEEGAFTGAKKGGKVGLFELADGGTIFLDEIGDISPKVQTKLLRVLQEKVVMPLGGTVIKGVDVRIIAATNKDLKKMVQDKQFRSDLYYRLKIGYINLPPLRERLDDLDALVTYFIKTETTEDVQMAQSARDELKKHKWYGNVRELESTIKYMLAVRNSNTLTIADLPDKRFFEEHVYDDDRQDDGDATDPLDEETMHILHIIDSYTSSNKIAGREKLTEELNEQGHSLTQYQMRTRLENLEKRGLVTMGRGKQGTTLTEKGMRYLEKQKRLSYK